MKKFIKDFKVDDVLSNVILAVKEKKLAKTKDGRDYLTIIFLDKTGDIGSKVWEDNLHLVQDIQVGDVAEVDALVEEYNGFIQLKLRSIKKADSFDASDFIETTEKDTEKMFSDLEKIVAGFKNKDLKNLIQDLFKNKDFVNKFKQAPGAEKLHHAYIGGLLDHINEMCDIAKVFIKNYPNLNSDLLFAGIILHDLGKMRELSLGTFIIRTVEGALLGHLVISLIWVEELISKQKEFPLGLKNELLHLIASHHGQLDFGSPIVPKTQEAVLLHHIDNISSKVSSAYKITQESLASSEVFSQFVRSFGTSLYLSDNFDDVLNEPKPKNLTLGF